MDIKEARQHVAEIFFQSGVIPAHADVTVREGAPDETIVLHCSWELKVSKPGASRISREITLQLNKPATKMFLAANGESLTTLDSKLRAIILSRLNDGYRETDSYTPFIIRIDSHDLG